MYKYYNHSFIIASLLLFFLSSPVYSQSSFEQLAKRKANVNQLLNAHNLSPKSDTYYLLALSAARKADYKQAKRDIRTGLQINPSNIHLINLKGVICARQGQYVMARRMFLTVLRLNPKNKYASLSLAEVEKQLSPRQLPMHINSSRQKNTSNPVSPVDEVISEKKASSKVLESSYFTSIKEKKRCFYNMKMLARAQSRYADKFPKKSGTFSPIDLVAEKFIPSIPICPQNGTYSMENKEIVCSKHGKMSIVGAEVKTVFTQFNKGMRDKLTRNYLDALKAFEQVVVLYPMWSEAHFQLGDTLFRLGETDMAVIEMRKCLKGEPKNLDALLLLANLYYKKGQKKAALNILDKVVNKHKGTVYSLAARSIAKSIRAGRNYYQIFPPN